MKNNAARALGSDVPGNTVTGNTVPGNIAAGDAIIKYTGAREIFRNIKNNLPMLISALAYILLQDKFTAMGLLTLACAAAALTTVFSQLTGLKSRVMGTCTAVKALSAVSTVGVCAYLWEKFGQLHSDSHKLDAPAARLGLSGEALMSAAGAVLVVLACLSVFVFCALLLQVVYDILGGAFSTVTRAEFAVYAVIALLTFAYVIAAFTRSRAFWGGPIGTDIIYTSDSAKLVARNAYMDLLNVENDIRQPLFAVFSSPFTGIGYALSLPLARLSEAVRPILMNGVQTALMLAANILLALTLGLRPAERACFVLLLCPTYMYLLFSVMMEQYLIAYFWLILAVYSYVAGGRAGRLLITAAGGTLLTSMALLPLGVRAEEQRQPKKLIAGCVSGGLYFLLALASFGRIDIFVAPLTKYGELSSFKDGVTHADMLRQYISFIGSCFVCPEIAPVRADAAYPAWLVDPESALSLSASGLLILGLCAASAVLCRGERIVRISALWVCFSALLLGIVGWGASEYGMVLYSLYFGWAYYVLLFRLLKKTSDKLGQPAVLYAASAVLAAVLAVLNYGDVADMLSFAARYYPV